MPTNPFSSGLRHGDADAAQAQSKPIITPTTDPERIDKSLLPLKKRATSDSSDREDSCFLVPLPPKKRRVDARLIPLQSHLDLLYQTVTEVGTSASSPDATTSQHQRLTSGGDEQPLHVTRPRRPAARDGAYVTMEEDETAPAKNKKKRKKTNRNRDRKKKSLPARVAAPPPLRLGTGLTQHLETLGATAPQFVCVKNLQKSDVDLNQNRLLFSCKRVSIERHPITGLLSHKETYLVHECKDGLRVTAFDDHGNEFGFKLRYLRSNGAYRFIGDWGDFVTEHGMQIHVDVQLWAFRSPSLPVQPKLPDKDKQRRLDGLQAHPDGALGLLLLFQVRHHDARNVHHAEEEKERAPAPRPVHETKRKASARQDNLADPHVSQNITSEDMVTAVGKEMADALMGLLMLRSICLRSKTDPCLLGQHFDPNFTLSTS
ncbi:hypothetical protein CFC21_017004 [Triticum aestivum]|uniref:TF-B3 domain-containing protein n=2 Tax=Triticum aestivum TaxID=4565 RepID=A0A9R1E004_WHEAT|nr:hypothetical protein CFC21_017004 [Triticum aestivum]